VAEMGGTGKELNIKSKSQQ